MFGSGLPVCAAFYQAVHELVGHEYNGLLFSSASELVAHLLRLCLLAPQNLYPFVTDESELVGDEEDYVHISSSKPTALGIKRISEEKLSARADADSKTVNSGRKGSQAEAKDTPTIDNTRSNVESKRKIGISEQKDISTTGYTSVSTTPLSALKTQPLTDIQRLKQGVLAIDTWDENWEQSMKPYILDILQKKSIPLVWSPSFAIIFFIFNLFGVYSLSLLLK